MKTIKTTFSRDIWDKSQNAAREVLAGRLRSQQEPQKGRFMQSDVSRILDRARCNIYDLMPLIPKQKSRENFRVIFLSITHLSIYRTLLNEGTEKDYATNLIGDIVWKTVSGSWRFMILKFIIRLITSNPHKQLGMQLRLLGRFVYTPPGYKHELSSDSNAYYWNFYRCPPLDFYSTQGEEALEMFRRTWCVVDFASAELMLRGVKYERPHTLSAGDNVCDMRWHVVR